MKLLMGKNHFEKYFKYLFIFTIFFMQNFIAIGSEKKSNNITNQKDYQFEEIYFRNSIPFSEYDNLENQLKTFLGLNSVMSETNYYKDLSLTKDSENLRKIYRSILNDMIVKEKTYFAE